MRSIKRVALSLLIILLTAPAALASPPRPNWREPKADFNDKELCLTYAFGPGALDFAPLDGLSLGVSADQIFSPEDWYYRATYRVVHNEDQGLDIAANLGLTQTRAQLAGGTFQPPVWGYQGGMLVTLQTQAGLILRGGFQIYNTDWHDGTGQSFLFTPEIAYRYNLFEVALAPGWPLSLYNWTWVGVRLLL